jgi:hypothetical protein
MNSAHKVYDPPTGQHKTMDRKAADLEAGLPLLVGNTSGQPLHNPFQEELPEDRPIFLKLFLFLWGLTLACVMRVILFCSTVNAKSDAMLFFITAGNVIALSSMLVLKFYNRRRYMEHERRMRVNQKPRASASRK